MHSVESERTARRGRPRSVAAPFSSRSYWRARANSKNARALSCDGTGWMHRLPCDGNRIITESRKNEIREWTRCILEQRS